MAKPLLTAGPLRVLARRPPPAPPSGGSREHRRKRKRPPPPGGGRGSDHPCSHRACRRRRRRRLPRGRRLPHGNWPGARRRTAPGECLSEARYNLLHRIAVSFVPYDISVFSPVTNARNHYNWCAYHSTLWRQLPNFIPPFHTKKNVTETILINTCTRPARAPARPRSRPLALSHMRMPLALAHACRPPAPPPTAPRPTARC